MRNRLGRILGSVTNLSPRFYATRVNRRHRLTTTAAARKNGLRLFSCMVEDTARRRGIQFSESIDEEDIWMPPGLVVQDCK